MVINNKIKKQSSVSFFCFVLLLMFDLRRLMNIQIIIIVRFNFVLL